MVCTEKERGPQKEFRVAGSDAQNSLPEQSVGFNVVPASIALAFNPPEIRPNFLWITTNPTRAIRMIFQCIQQTGSTIQIGPDDTPAPSFDGFLSLLPYPQP